MKRLSDEAIKVLGSMRIDSNTAYDESAIAYLPPGQLDRKLYAEVNKALEALGGLWNRKAKGHVFGIDPEGALTQVVNNGGFIDKSQELGFFETPKVLAKQLVDSIDLQDGHRVLEPSAGNGRILEAIINHPARTNITAVEIDESRSKLLASHFEMTYNHSGCVVIADFLTLKPREDFLEPNQSAHYDRVAMNPPFAKQADIDHVTHAITHLKPGGRLGAIMSASVNFRQNKKTINFKAMLEQETYFQMEDLPTNSFKESGTNVNTVMLVLTKKT